MTADETSTQVIRLFLVDDHEIVRRGLGELIGTDPRFEIVGEAATAAAAVARVGPAAPDLVLLDVRLPDGNGIEVCRDLRSDNPDLVVVMLTSYRDDRAELGAALAGASAYVLKDVAGAALLQTLTDAAAGRQVLSPAEVIARHPDVGPDRAWQSLSGQERRVLEGIGEGLTNRAIAERMYLSEKTVKHYVSTLLRKLGLERRTQAAAYITRLHDEGRDRDD